MLHTVKLYVRLGNKAIVLATHTKVVRLGTRLLYLLHTLKLLSDSVTRLLYLLHTPKLLSDSVNKAIVIATHKICCQTR